MGRVLQQPLLLAWSAQMGLFELVKLVVGWPEAVDLVLRQNRPGDQPLNLQPNLRVARLAD